MCRLRGSTRGLGSRDKAATLRSVAKQAKSAGKSPFSKSPSQRPTSPTLEQPFSAARYCRPVLLSHFFGLLLRSLECRAIAAGDRSNAASDFLVYVIGQIG